VFILESELMAQARRALREERLEDAQGLLVNVVVQEPSNDEAWLMLAELIQDPQRKMECLEQARRIDSRNPATLRAIQQLQNEIAAAAIEHAPGSEKTSPSELTTRTEPVPTPNLPTQPDLAGPLLREAEIIAHSVIMSTEPGDTRQLGLALVQKVEQAIQDDETRARRWARSGGRDALVKYEKTLTILITNLPQDDSQLTTLREQRQRALDVLK
jgi:hypothetical protein